MKESRSYPHVGPEMDSTASKAEELSPDPGSIPGGSNEIEATTQVEAYYLYDRYGGYLDAHGLAVLNTFLEAMSHPEQHVAEVKDVISNKLYYATLALLAKLDGFRDAGVPDSPPQREPQRRRRSREEAARDAVAGRRVARTTWARIVRGVHHSRAPVAGEESGEGVE